MQRSLLIAIGAGLASAALYASAWTGTALGIFVLLFLSPMPVGIAGLGWGWAAGAIATATGTAVVALAAGSRSGLVYLITMAGPAAVFSWLALLNRPVSGPDGEEAVEWYPIGRIVAWAALWAALATAAGLLSIGTDAAAIRTYMQELLERTRLLEGAGPGASVTEAQKQGFAGLMTAFMPWAIATTWFAVVMFNMWAAARVTLRSGMLIRPWPDFTVINLPPAMPIAFGLAALGTFASDMVGLIASGFASALVFAYMLVGLGMIHRFTRGYAIRPIALAIVYAALLFIPPFSNLLVAFLGLAEPMLRGRPPDNGTTQQT